MPATTQPRSELYVVTSSVTLAEVHPGPVGVGRRQRPVDQARLDRILTEHDPFATP